MTPRADILAVLDSMADAAERDAMHLCERMRTDGVFRALDIGEESVASAATSAALRAFRRLVAVERSDGMTVREIEVLRDVCALRTASLGNYPGELSRFLSDARVRSVRSIDAAAIVTAAERLRPAPVATPIAA